MDLSTLTSREKIELRENALRSSIQINPMRLNHQQMTGISHQEKVSVSDIIKDAETIYNFLIKE